MADTADDLEAQLPEVERCMRDGVYVTLSADDVLTKIPVSDVIPKLKVIAATFRRVAEAL